MKNNFLIIIFIVFFSEVLSAENFDISAKNISIDKKNEISIFKENVVVQDEYGNLIKSDYASYDNKLQKLNIRGNITVQTSEGYNIDASEIELDKKSKFILSKKPSIIRDKQKNKIYLDNFEYLAKKNIFKSVGNIKIIDQFDNVYKFSQIYIDEKKKELIGTDSKVFFNQKDLIVNEGNKPRIFSNTVNIKSSMSNFTKSTFTTCDYRDNDKCPPWELTASEIRHDNLNKTVYYDNAVIRIYNVPILFFPKLAHPDPTVKRRSGFLIPSFQDSKNLGAGINIPYFWAIDSDKDFTLKNKLFVNEHPLFLGEYRQALKDSNLIFDFGYTGGYKKTSSLKKAGDKSHFFAKFTKKFTLDENRENNLEINLKHVSNKKYLKLYRIESTLVDNFETSTLENFMDFNHYDDERDLSLNLKASVYSDLRDNYNDKYEYVLPEINLNKYLYSENFGYGDISSNIKIRNYETNKYEKFFTNDLKWSFDKSFNNLPYDGAFIAHLKNVNYEVKNISNLKEDTVNEVYGAIGYLSSVDLIKQDNQNTSHFLRPKLLLKYAPNHMKKNEDSNANLIKKNIFDLDRANSSSNFEGGSSLTYGVEYEAAVTNDKKFNFSIGQIINEKKNNKNMPNSSSLDKRFSDVVGNLNYTNNDNFNLNYNYVLDRKFGEMNYSEIDARYTLGNIGFNISYLEEHNIDEELDKKDYLKSSIEIKKGDNGLFTLSNKRNFLTNSSEYYNLSYEYINDCLRAGLVYRREFYNDSELEPENSLMFKITLSPFGSIKTPQINE